MQIEENSIVRLSTGESYIVRRISVFNGVEYALMVSLASLTLRFAKESEDENGIHLIFETDIGKIEELSEYFDEIKRQEELEVKRLKGKNKKK